MTVSMEIDSTIEELEVYDAPELEDLNVSGTYGEFRLQKFTVKNCPLLNKVSLDGKICTAKELNQLLASSNNLENLIIRGCVVLDNVIISSDSLKTLNLSGVIHLRNLEFFSPTLKTFTFDLSHLHPEADFSLNGLDGGVEVNLRTLEFNSVWVKLFPHFKHIKKLTLNQYRWGFKLDESNLLPFYGTNDISFITDYKFFSFSELQYLLCLAPRAERVSILCSSNNTTLASLELVFREEEVEKKNFNCNYCKLLPVDCWRHCLKEVRIHKFDGNRVCLVLMKDYFYREVENLEFLFKEMDDKVNFVSRNLPIFSSPK